MTEEYRVRSSRNSSAGDIQYRNHNDRLKRGGEGDSTTASENGNTRYVPKNPYSKQRKGKKTSKKNSPKKNMAKNGKAAINEAVREAATRKKSVEIRRRLILAACAVGLFITVCLVFYRYFFVVTEINLSGAGTYSKEEILEASGIGEGVNLYSFKSSIVADNITLNCPRVSSVKLERTIPNKLSITVVEELPAYYAEVYGEYVLLSENMRVLGSCSDISDVPPSLVRLKLPCVSYAVAGRQIIFSEGMTVFAAKGILDEVQKSSLASRITLVDLRDKFDVYFACDDMFKLEVGDSSDLSYKLRAAAGVLEHEMFTTGNKYIVDLTIREKVGVTTDNLLSFE